MPQQAVARPEVKPLAIQLHSASGACASCKVRVRPENLLKMQAESLHHRAGAGGEGPRRLPLG